MSGVEDSQDASERDDAREATEETAEVTSNEVAGSSTEESDSPELSSEGLSTKEAEEERREAKERTQLAERQTEEEGDKQTPSCEEAVKEGTSKPELATVTRSASTTTPTDDGVSPAASQGIGASELRRTGSAGLKLGQISATNDGDDVGRRSGGQVGAAVGEWNSLPILVERLREALELSLAAGRRRADEPTANSSSSNSSSLDATRDVDVGAEVSDRSHVARRSVGQTILFGGDHPDHGDVPEPDKDELKFLEDLLLSDIQTALSRLRETLERTDVATLAKHGGVSDPTSKLHLLRLVSSLLSRLQVPREEDKEEKVTTKTVINGDNRANGVAILRNDVSPAARRRRGVRHTIGVSAEEIAWARKQLEESNVELAKWSEPSSAQQQRETLLAPAASNGEKHVEEIRDKCTKDAINHRQSLRDKSKEYRAIAPTQIAPVDRSPVIAATTGDQDRLRNADESQRDPEKDSDEGSAIERRTSEEQSRVTKLAAVLRQRAELAIANKCTSAGNKFTVKKSKIKRANTVDIPSYLKLQTDSLGYDNGGCALLRRPIRVGDKVTACASNGLTVPSFCPRTENDKKFLALISRNNESQQAALNAAPVYKSFGYTKATDMSSLTNENWNSRFSNIKTAFDKPAPIASDDSKLSPKPRPAKPRHSISQTSSSRTPSNDSGSTHNGLPNVTSKPDDTAGFRHAPSSLFRKIEKPCSPISPPVSHVGGSWHRENAPSPGGTTLREKARIMFDRDGNVRSQQSSHSDGTLSQRSSFPRPPWIEHDRNETKTPNDTVTENGRLDYRLFCKQFAPFVGKSNNNAAAEPKRWQNSADPRKRRESRPARSGRALATEDAKIGVVDGKISFRMFPEKGTSRAPSGYRPGVDAPVQRNGLDYRGEKNTRAESATTIDATLRGSSSVAIQTGTSDDDRSEEARVFRVVPRTTGTAPFACSNASVQTHAERESLPTSRIESKEQWTASRYERDDADLSALNPARRPTIEDARCLPVLDHNRNYHATSPRNDASSLTSENARERIKDSLTHALNSTETAPFRETFGHRSPKQISQTSPRCENYLSPAELATDDRSHQNYFPNYAGSDRDSCGANDDDDGGSVLPEERNIQNQDISVAAGVVTRYTCAIATVASTADIPEARSDGASSQTATPSTLSPSSQHWAQRPKPIDGETANDATEDEIRRHNMLQQSLVRRLQNERTMLNHHRDFRAPVADQFSSFNQPSKFPLEPPKRPEPPKRSEALKRIELPRKSESLRKSEVVTGLLSVPQSTGFSATNRVTALREQYEQPGIGQTTKTIQKERSPIPNGVSGNVMDSSDEYLVSCSSRPSRSIVLSKSESWHQLALSGGHHHHQHQHQQQQQQQQQHHHHHHHISRSSQSGLPPPSLSTSSSSSHTSASYLPKPPKSKSPSSFRMKKQYEASSSSDSVRKMEDKIRRYFDSPNDSADARADTKGRRFSSRDTAARSLMSLSRSRTMPGICDEKNMRLLIPSSAAQLSAANLSLNSADVDKVFDDIFEEATKADDHRF